MKQREASRKKQYSTTTVLLLHIHITYNLCASTRMHICILCYFWFLFNSKCNFFFLLGMRSTVRSVNSSVRIHQRVLMLGAGSSSLCVLAASLHQTSLLRSGQKNVKCEKFWRNQPTTTIGGFCNRTNFVILIKLSFVFVFCYDAFLVHCDSSLFCFVVHIFYWFTFSTWGTSSAVGHQVMLHTVKRD